MSKYVVITYPICYTYAIKIRREERRCKKMKTRKQGNAVVLTVPKKFGIKPNREFVAIKGDLDSITYIPKLENIFVEAEKSGTDLRYDDVFD